MIDRDGSRIYTDAHGNRRFSGGPVVFVQNGRSANELRAAGVVNDARRTRLEAVFDRLGQPILGKDSQPMAYFPENQGFVVAFNICHATDLTQAKYIGSPLATDQEKRW